MINMTTVQNTVSDVSRAVADLDENGTYSTEIDQVSVGAMRQRVARNIAYVIKYGVPSNEVTARDVRMIMASHGARQITVARHAATIAKIMRSADFD